MSVIVFELRGKQKWPPPKFWNFKNVCPILIWFLPEEFVVKITVKVTPNTYLYKYLFLFSSPGLKGHVTFCHHFAFVVVGAIFFSITTVQISTKLGRNVGQIVLYQICEINAHRIFKMAVRANYVFWFIQILKICLSETAMSIELILFRNYC